MIGTSGNPIIIIIGFPIILITSSKVLNILSKNKVKDSLFSVSKKGKIVQNALANPLKIIEQTIPVIEKIKTTETMTNQKRIDELKKLREELILVDHTDEKTNQK